MQIFPSLSWTLDAEAGEAIDPRLIPVLEAIAAHGTLAQAAITCGISYRAAWGLLRQYELVLGSPLVVLERGRGARLAAAGEKILAAHRAAKQRLERLLLPVAIDVGLPRPRPAGWRLNIAASHDLALAALRDASASARGVTLQMAFMGSLHALQQFREGRVDAAGFHVPLDGRARSLIAVFRRKLDARDDRLVRVVDREQGLILRRGNPARVRGFHDIARKRLRFINRQRGSGTRLLIDRLIAEDGIDAARITGYATEEFTHAAVAATVASGAADAGFGLRAAAAECALAFLPRVEERYYLAIRADALTTPPVRRLIELLQSAVFKKIVSRLPGYRGELAGSVVRASALAEREVRGSG